MNPCTRHMLNLLNVSLCLRCSKMHFDFYNVLPFHVLFLSLHYPFSLLAFVLLLVQLHYRDDFVISSSFFKSCLITSFLSFSICDLLSQLPPFACLLSAHYGIPGLSSHLLCGHAFPRASQATGNLFCTSFSAYFFLCSYVSK